MQQVWRLVSLTILSGVSLGGCTNYPAVSSLSASMNKGVGAWRLYTGDYGDTCKRREKYKAAFGNTPDDCSLALASERGADVIIEVLTDYFGALSAVATDSNYDITPGIDALASSAKDDLKLDETKTAAVSGLAKFLVSLAVSGIREHSVKELISQADNASTAVDAIVGVVDNYAIQLNREAKEFENSYGPVGIGASLNLPACAGSNVSGSVFNAGSSSPQQILYQNYYVEQCNLILKRHSAVDSFSVTAVTIKSSLNDLKSSKTRLGIKATVDLLQSKAAELTKQTRAIKEAFAAEKTNV